MPNPTTTPASGWPALYGLEAYQPARPELRDRLFAPEVRDRLFAPEVRGRLLAYADGVVTLLTPDGVALVQVTGLRFADPAEADARLAAWAP